MSAGIIIVLLLALVLVIFTLQNSVLVDLHVLFWQLSDVPLVMALLVCLICGVLIGLFVFYPKLWKLKSRLKEQQKIINQYQTKVPEELNSKEKNVAEHATEETTKNTDFFSE